MGDADAALVAGSPVRFTVVLTTSAPAACSLVPVLTVVVTSGHDRIWTSADCPVSGVGGPGVTATPDLTGTARSLLVPGGAPVAPRGSATLDLVWPGVRSAGSCTAAPGSLSPGTYVAAVSVAGSAATDVAFALH